MSNIINKLKERRNWVRENIIGSKRFNVEVPEFKNADDLLKEEGMNIHVKGTNEKSHDIHLRVKYKPDYNDDWVMGSDTYEATFTYTNTNGYTFSKSGRYLESTVGSIKRTKGFNIKQLLSRMKEEDKIKISKPIDDTGKCESVDTHGGVFNDITNQCISSLIEVLQRQIEKSPQQIKKEEQIKRKFINDAYKGF